MTCGQGFSFQIKEDEGRSVLVEVSSESLDQIANLVSEVWRVGIFVSFFLSLIFLKQYNPKLLDKTCSLVSLSHSATFLFSLVTLFHHL